MQKLERSGTLLRGYITDLARFGLYARQFMLRDTLARSCWRHPIPQLCKLRK